MDLMTQFRIFFEPINRATLVVSDIVHRQLCRSRCCTPIASVHVAILSVRPVRVLIHVVELLLHLRHNVTAGTIVYRLIDRSAGESHSMTRANREGTRVKHFPFMREFSTILKVVQALRRRSRSLTTSFHCSSRSE